MAGAVVPPSPPSNVFRNRGTPPVPPAGAAPPAPRLGAEAASFLPRRVWSRLPASGGGERDRGLTVTEAVVPPGPPSNVFGNRGTRCTPAGAALPAPCLGNGGVGVFPPGALGCFLALREGIHPLPNLPPSTRAGTEPPTRAGVGMGDSQGAGRGFPAFQQRLRALRPAHQASAKRATASSSNSSPSPGPSGAIISPSSMAGLSLNSGKDQGM